VSLETIFDTLIEKKKPPIIVHVLFVSGWISCCFWVRPSPLLPGNLPPPPDRWNLVAPDTRFLELGRRPAEE